MEITVNHTIKVDVDPLVVIEKLIGEYYFNQFDELCNNELTGILKDVKNDTFNYYKALHKVRNYLYLKSKQS